jgi:hypothetical protein
MLIHRLSWHLALRVIFELNMTEKLYEAPCEPCRGTGGLELNGGQSMSNEYFPCEACEGSGTFLMDRTEYLCLFPDKCDCIACVGIEKGHPDDEWCFLHACDITEDGVRSMEESNEPGVCSECKICTVLNDDNTCRECGKAAQPRYRDFHRLVIEFTELAKENPKVLEDED